MPSTRLTCMCAHRILAISDKVGGIPEVVNHGENGLLFERESVEGLAGHLISLIENRSLHAKLAENAAVKSRMFSMKVYVDKVFECYNTCLAVALSV